LSVLHLNTSILLKIVINLSHFVSKFFHFDDILVFIFTLPNWCKLHQAFEKFEALSRK
jgi:hypothetical protein